MTRSSPVEFATTPLAVAVIAAGAVLPLQASAEVRASILEEVIVTAQKREESLQDASIAVSALSGEQLEVRGITGLTDLMAGAMPMVKFTPFPNNPATFTVSIRGIGTVDPGQVTREPGVGIYQDGIYLGRSQGLGLDMADLERIEVLRGPQGTLYGRNVIGGAINLISKKPAGEFGFKQTLSYGFEYDDLKSVTHIDSPQFNGFAAKLSLIYSDHDGWVENQGAGSNFQDYSGYEKRGGRFALNWNNESNLSLDYVYDYSDADVMMHYLQFHDAGQLAVLNADITPPPDFATAGGIGEFLGNVASGAYFAAMEPFPNDESPNRTEDTTRAALALRPNEIETEGHAFTLSWDLNETMTLKSLSSYRELEQETHVNYGGVIGIGLATPAPFDQIEQEQWSEELQLVGSTEKIDYVLGAYYYHEEASEITPPIGTAMEVAFIPLTTDPSQAFNPELFAPFIVTRDGELSTLDESQFLSPTETYPNRVVSAETDSWALFGQARWQATEKFALTLGLRYTSDEKTAERPYDLGVPVNQVSDIDDSSTDPMVTLDYDWSEDVNTYLRYATGYKASGVNLRSRSFAEYDKETVETFELGLKSTFWNQRARVNTAIWSSVYSDYQIDFSNPNDPTISESFNATNGDVDLWGVELEMSIVPVEGLVFSIDYSYLEWDLDPQPNPLNPGGELEVFEITNAPRHSGSIGVDYEFEPLSYGTWRLHADYFGQSASGMRFGSKDNPRRADRNIVNARITLDNIYIGSDNGHLRAALWGKNILDEDYLLGNLTFPASGSSSDNWGEPRSIGVELRYEY